MRRYEVSIDSKPSGNYTLRFTPSQGGTDVISDCEVNQKILLFRYHYKYHGHEVWNHDRVVSFESDSDDNGKHCQVAAQPAGAQLTVNGKNRKISATTLTSSYWRLPGAPADNYTQEYLEVDTGRTFNATLQRVADETIKIGERSEPCHHYKLTGGDECDLWYDRDNKLVRQTSSSIGHKTLVQLKSIEH